MSTGVGPVLARPARALRDADLLDVASVAAVLVQLANMQEQPGYQLLFAFVGAPLIAVPGLRRSRPAWVIFLAMCVAWTGSRFLGLDNHVIASTYLIGIVTLARFADDPPAVLRRAAALTVGLIFAFATAWKLGSGQFLDGTFFRIQLLFDERFEHVARLSGTNSEMLAEAQQSARLAMAEGPGTVTVLRDGARAPGIAWFMTWWTVVIEAAVAALFLIWSRRLELFGHLSLLGFMVGAYLAVPVSGFGALLCVLAATAASDRRWRVVYAAAFVLILLWSPVWRVLFG